RGEQQIDSDQKLDKEDEHEDELRYDKGRNREALDFPEIDRNLLSKFGDVERVYLAPENIKYLPKFRWNNLTEQIVYENRERIHRLQAEISKSRKEIKDYVKKSREKNDPNIEEKKSKK
ncbi:3454_t:CDS:2, partial [Cetraspora pellucida]